jgi:hypothetical protein
MIVFDQKVDTRTLKELNEEDIKALHALYHSLREICAQAKERGVRVRTV